MPSYGAVYRPANPAWNVPTSGWSNPQQEYIRQNPQALNAWVLNQYPTSGRDSLGSRYRGFLQTWLGDQLNAFQGYSLANPEASYEQFLGGRSNPWEDYQSANPLRLGARSAFGPRILRG